MQVYKALLPLFSFQGTSPDIVGVFNGEGPPVPIPNTEVKLTSADNTCLATDWKDRSTPTQSRSNERLFFYFMKPFAVFVVYKGESSLNKEDQYGRRNDR